MHRTQQSFYKECKRMREHAYFWKERMPIAQCPTLSKTVFERLSIFTDNEDILYQVTIENKKIKLILAFPDIWSVSLDFQF